MLQAPDPADAHQLQAADPADAMQLQAPDPADAHQVQAADPADAHIHQQGFIDDKIHGHGYKWDTIANPDLIRWAHERAGTSPENVGKPDEQFIADNPHEYERFNMARNAGLEGMRQADAQGTAGQTGGAFVRASLGSNSLAGMAGRAIMRPIAAIAPDSFMDDTYKQSLKDSWRQQAYQEQTGLGGTIGGVGGMIADPVALASGEVIGQGLRGASMASPGVARILGEAAPAGVDATQWATRTLAQKAAGAVSEGIPMGATYGGLDATANGGSASDVAQAAGKGAAVGATLGGGGALIHQLGGGVWNSAATKLIGETTTQAGERQALARSAMEKLTGDSTQAGIAPDAAQMSALDKVANAPASRTILGKGIDVGMGALSNTDNWFMDKFPSVAAKLWMGKAGALDSMGKTFESLGVKIPDVPEPSFEDAAKNVELMGPPTKPVPLPGENAKAVMVRDAQGKADWVGNWNAGFKAINTQIKALEPDIKAALPPDVFQRLHEITINHGDNEGLKGAIEHLDTLDMDPQLKAKFKTALTAQDAYLDSAEKFLKSNGMPTLRNYGIRAKINPPDGEGSVSDFTKGRSVDQVRGDDVNKYHTWGAAGDQYSENFNNYFANSTSAAGRMTEDALASVAHQKLDSDRAIAPDTKPVDAPQADANNTTITNENGFIAPNEGTKPVSTISAKIEKSPVILPHDSFTLPTGWKSFKAYYKTSKVNFQSDLDKAIYFSTSKNGNAAARAELIADKTGLSLEDIEKYGETLRENMKSMKYDKDGVLIVKPTVSIEPQATASKPKEPASSGIPEQRSPGSFSPQTGTTVPSSDRDLKSALIEEINRDQVATPLQKKIGIAKINQEFDARSKTDSDLHKAVNLVSNTYLATSIPTLLKRAMHVPSDMFTQNGINDTVAGIAKAFSDQPGGDIVASKMHAQVSSMNGMAEAVAKGDPEATRSLAKHLMDAIMTPSNKLGHALLNTQERSVMSALTRGDANAPVMLELARHEPEFQQAVMQQAKAYAAGDMSGVSLELPAFIMQQMGNNAPVSSLNKNFLQLGSKGTGFSMLMMNLGYMFNKLSRNLNALGDMARDGFTSKDPQKVQNSAIQAAKIFGLAGGLNYLEQMGSQTAFSNQVVDKHPPTTAQNVAGPIRESVGLPGADIPEHSTGYQALDLAKRYGGLPISMGIDAGVSAAHVVTGQPQKNNNSFIPQDTRNLIRPVPILGPVAPLIANAYGKVSNLVRQP